jgi:hypothetical protein
LPGFVRITGPDELVFPDYDGNGMFRSLGNILTNPQVGLLFLRVGERPGRLRINGKASVAFDDPRMAGFAGAQALVRVAPTDIFPNCPRYIPRLEVIEPSAYAPRPDAPPLEPAWKNAPMFKNVVPLRRA